MSVKFILSAEARSERGTSSARRLRGAGKVPAIVYGKEGGEAQSISLEHKEIVTALQDEAIFSHIVELTLGGTVKQDVLIKDVQRHPYKTKIMHVDFQRVNKNEAVQVMVPLEVLHAAKSPGVKQAGGLLQVHIPEIAIRCLPALLPERIVFDAANLEINQVVHLSQISLPAGVQLAEAISGPDQDPPVLICQQRKLSEETDTEAPEASS